MQRQEGLPASIIFVVQSLIVLFLLASDLVRYYRLRLRRCGAAGERRAERGPDLEIELFSATFLVAWLAAAIRLAGPLLLAALGEIFCERSGVLNIGIEGTMLLGAVSCYLAALGTGAAGAGLIAGLAAGAMAGLFLAWMYVTVRASQVVVGIIFNIQALGLAAYTYRLAMQNAAGPQAIAMLGAYPVPGLSELPYVGRMLFEHTPLLYATVTLVPLAAFVLYRTRFGLDLRAVGENPQAAEAAGISVAAMRYAGVLLSCTAAGAAGACLVLAQVGQFRETIVSRQGFIALAIVIFGRWNPFYAMLAAVVFGAANALQLSLQLVGVPLPPQLLLALPYLLTVVAMSGILGGAQTSPRPS